MKKIILIVVVIVIVMLCCSLFFGYRYVTKNKREVLILNQMIERMESETRIAQIIVTNVSFDELQGTTKTTIKFLEYDNLGNPLKPQYFTFSGNIIQFQSMVIRFDDIFIKEGDALKGKSISLFLKVFMLDGKNTEEYEITSTAGIPDAYKLGGIGSSYEGELWEHFWEYALNNKKARSVGIKNAQIEAPGTMFMPGTIYTINIEHDGGMRIDSAPVPDILKGEFVLPAQTEDSGQVP